MPDAASFIAAAAMRPAGPARPMLPTDWRTAEEIACLHMRGLGFDDAETTPPGRDGGLDVTASQAVAQVKMLALPVGAPPVQQLRGTRPLTANHLFYSTSGYTAAAVESADEIGVALFRIERDGTVNEVNGHAVEMAQAGAGARVAGDAVAVVSEAVMTRHVTAYADGVAARIMNAATHTDQSRTHDDERYPGQWRRMAGYLRQALDNLEERPSEFPSLRAAMIYFHHTELLAHVFFQEMGVPYPEGGGVTDDDLSSYYT
ncbi:restriction endonuclease [Actinoplanes sp. NPDC026670]|uniref:restriction endonuclease n=1 Tax=Actinoplanes sp. NPDC026670 TaxID=3154700 RepID=UPI0033DB4000